VVLLVGEVVNHGWRYGVLRLLLVWLMMGVVGLVMTRLSDFRVSRETIPDLAFAFAPAVFGLIAAWQVGSRPGSLRFHEISAEVIPVLFLALVFQAKAFDFTRVHLVVDGLYVMMSFLIMTAGEYQALESVFLGRPAHGDIVAAALATGLVAIFLRSALVPAGRDRTQQRSDD